MTIQLEMCNENFVGLRRFLLAHHDANSAAPAFRQADADHLPCPVRENGEAYRWRDESEGPVKSDRPKARQVAEAIPGK
jgi:hypothetical protein